LSERWQGRREGAEQITEAIEKSFESILLVAYENGGSLLKFGGDALLLWFEGADTAVRAAARPSSCGARCAASAGSRFPAPRSRCEWRRACIRDPSISSPWAHPTELLPTGPDGAAW
jgi:hypothetical protein